MGLSLIIWYLALGWLGQVSSGTEYENPVKKVVGGTGSGLGGALLRDELLC